MPVKYQNVGCGISVIVAGLEQSYGDYKEIKVSIDGVNYISTSINIDNKDFSNPVTFDNLEENRYYNIYAQLVLNNDNIINIKSKVLSQVGLFTVELSPEMKIQYYNGGGKGNFDLPKEVI